MSEKLKRIFIVLLVAIVALMVAIIAILLLYNPSGTTDKADVSQKESALEESAPQEKLSAEEQALQAQADAEEQARQAQAEVEAARQAQAEAEEQARQAQAEAEAARQAQADAEEQARKTQAAEESSSNDNGTYTVNGSHCYTVQLPNCYKDKVKIVPWEGYDAYVLKECEATAGGVLFTIEWVPIYEADEARSFCDGSRVLYQDNSQTIFIGHPTDVQCDIETQDIYSKMASYYDQIADSFEYH